MAVSVSGYPDELNMPTATARRLVFCCTCGFKPPTPARATFRSGSIKANDPQFLTKQVVAKYLDGQAPGTRLGLVMLAEKAARTLPLTARDGAAARHKVLDRLAPVDDSGKITNRPASLERGSAGRFVLSDSAGKTIRRWEFDWEWEIAV